MNQNLRHTTLRAACRRRACDDGPAGIAAARPLDGSQGHFPWLPVAVGDKAGFLIAVDGATFPPGAAGLRVSPVRKGASGRGPSFAWPWGRWSFCPIPGFIAAPLGAPTRLVGGAGFVRSMQWPGPRPLGAALPLAAGGQPRGGGADGATGFGPPAARATEAPAAGMTSKNAASARPAPAKTLSARFQVSGWVTEELLFTLSLNYTGARYPSVG